MVKRSFIFDLDGTLWDSKDWYANLISSLSDRYKCDVLRDLSCGLNVSKLIRKSAITTQQCSQYIHQEISSLTTYPGVHECLRELVRRGSLLGIVTNLPKWLAMPILEAGKFNEYFDSVFTYKRGYRKPSPRGIESVMRELNIESQKWLYYIGDTETDAEAANAANVKFAWISFGYGENKPPNTERTIDYFEEILDL